MIMSNGKLVMNFYHYYFSTPYTSYSTVWIINKVCFYYFRYFTFYDKKKSKINIIIHKIT